MGPRFFIRPLRPRREGWSAILFAISGLKSVEGVVIVAWGDRGRVFVWGK